MTTKRLIHGSYSEQRYLHSDEIFRKERNWNINLPFEREFKNGYCIITDKDDTAYSIDELVELLNEFQKENEQLKKELKRCKDWIKSDKYDYELTLAFIKNKGYSLKDVLEYEKELKMGKTM